MPQAQDTPRLVAGRVNALFERTGIHPSRYLATVASITCMRTLREARECACAILMSHSLAENKAAARRLVALPKE
jgi:hypothetical protein